MGPAFTVRLLPCYHPLFCPTISCQRLSKCCKMPQLSLLLLGPEQFVLGSCPPKMQDFPSWGYLEARLAHLEAYVGPLISSHKIRKMGKNGKSTKNTVKRGSFWRHAVYCAWGGGPSLLWRGEKRLRQGHGQEAWCAIVVARVVL